ncbi:MAG: hypothetical protein H6606_05595 [Flavobacteriales bacterium]|nr:hypothetical protein [Flavobacteriales bacterium]
MVRSWILGFSIVGTVLFSCSKGTQKTGGEVHSDNGSDAAALYARALALGDDLTAIVALNQLLLADPDNLDYKDSLATMYLKSGKKKPGIKLGAEVLEARPDNDKLLELVSFARELNGETEAAIAGFSKLFDKTGDESYRYEIAKVQYSSGDYGSAKKTLNELSTSDKEGQKIEFLAQEGTQQVPVQAAAHFLLAQIAVDQNQESEAVNQLRKAVTIDPNFEQALYSLQQLQAMLAQKREQQELQRLQQKYGR